METQQTGASMQQSVESYCNLLVRSRLLAADEVRAVYQRWQQEGGAEAALTGRFAQWLVAQGHVTLYQASRLARGRTQGYFLDQYKILSKIERGPQAGMYQAVHQLGQVVAIKVHAPNKARGRQETARFLNEAQLALRLQHPNVIRSFQVGQAEGRYFLAMEHVTSASLADVLARRGKLLPAEAVRLVHQALLGLQHLHEQGIIHRDLKPANLILGGLNPGADSTAQAVVKIVDIDLGRGLPQQGVVGQTLVGTPAYVSPEQARDPRAVDIRSDIYSLGCVLYHCLAGQPPFQDSEVARQLPRHAAEQAPRPLREFNPAVPDGLQQIVNWMLAQDPGGRYPTPERAAQALQVFLVAGTETAAAPGTDPRMKSYLTWLQASENSNPAVEALPGKRMARDANQGAASAPTATAAAPATTPPGVPQPMTSFDVELVPLEQLTPPRERPRGLTELNRRDLLMLGFGSGGALFAVFLGWLLARGLRRTPPEGEEGDS